MKLIAHSLDYGGRSHVRITWRESFYFQDPEPRKDRLITLNLPDLERHDAADVRQWLKERGRTSATDALVSDDRREIFEFAAEDWEYTVLEDFLDAENYANFIWYISEHFTLEEIVAFESKHMPRAWEAARSIDVPREEHAARDAALARIQELFVRTHSTAYGAQNRVGRERDAAQEGADREQIAAFDSTAPNSIDEWAELIARLKSYRTQYEMVDRFGQRIADETHDPEKLTRILERLLRQHRKVADMIQHQPQFWGPLRPWLSFAPNVLHETIDVSDAVEVVVPAHLSVVESKRVGPIVPGRRSLCIPSRTSFATYIRADRRLLFRILESGGSIRKHGCTLTADVDGRSIRPLLTQVEELIVLANLAPQRALEKIADLDLDPEHTVFEAAQRARDDHRWAHIFGDLLIELRTGLDADVARRLVG